MNLKALTSMYQAMQNPSQFLQNMMGNSRVMGNPMMKNAIEMMQRGDRSGIEQMAKNLCREQGINPNEAIVHLKQQLGIR